MRFFLLLFAFFNCYEGEAQLLQGKIIDSSGTIIHGAIVALSDTDQKRIIAFSMSDTHGQFIIKVDNVQDTGILLLTIRHVGFLEKKIIVQLGEAELKLITLSTTTKTLEEILIRSDLPIKVKGDTTTFDMQKFITPEDKRLRDVFAKVPGFKVDENGRLTFKGKMVEKIFIDGDDPAGFNYGLITQNLSPDGVDKIDVVEDFSDDRLMRKVKLSDVVGVNIRMKSEYQMKLTGNAELGLSVGKKRAGHLSANLLGKKIKSLNFISANNSGQSLGENYSGRIYRSKEELLAEAMGSEDEIQMVEMVNIPAPNIDERLTLHNNDYGMASLMSWRLGKYVKMNGQFGFVKTNQWIKREQWSVTKLPDVNSWETFGNEILQNDEKRMFSTFSFKKDKGLNTTSKGHLMLSRVIGKQNHFNKLTGDVSDSMNEMIYGKQWLYDINWSKTVLSGKNVFRIALQSELQDGRQFFDIYTKRLYNYFKIVPSFSDYLQASAKKVSANSIEVRVNQKNKNVSFEYGWRTRYIKNISGFEQIAKSKDSTLKSIENSNLNISLLTSALIGNLQLENKQKWSLELSGNVGMGMLTRNKVESTSPDFSTNLTLNRKLNRKKTLMLGYLWSSSFVDWIYFVPDKILSSNATIQKTLNYTGPSTKHSISATLYSFNMLKQRNFVALVEYTQNKFLYNSSSYSFPEYSIINYERFKNNPEFRVMFSQDFYVRFLRSTIQFGLNWLDQKGGMFLNGKYAKQSNKIGGLNWSFNTGFDFPLNGEFGWQLNFVEYNWGSELPSINWQKSWKSKIRWKVNKNAFMAGRWKWYQLAPNESFSSVDFYATSKFKRSIELKIEATNLLNLSVVKTRRVSSYSESVTSLELNRRFFLLTMVYFF